MKDKRTFFVAVNFVLVVLLFAMVPATSFSKDSSKKPIVLGMATDQSGPTANNGLIEAPVVKMVVAAVNKAGGIQGRPVEISVTDHGADATKIIGQLKMFRNRKKCVAAITGTTTTVTKAAKAWAERTRIPIVAPDAMSDILNVPKGKSWLFRVNSPNSVVIKAALLKIKNMGLKKVGFIGTAQTWGTDGLNCVKTFAPNYGLEMVGYQLLEAQSKDASIQVRKLKKTGAEALVQLDHAAEIGVWGRAFQQVGWHPQIVTYDGSFLIAMTMYPAELFESWRVVGTIDPSKPLLNKVWKDTAEYTGKSLSSKDSRTVHHGCGYDAANVLMEALRLSSDPDNPESIRDAFYKINVPLALGCVGAMGNFEIGRNYTVQPQSMVISVVKSGKLVKD